MAEYIRELTVKDDMGRDCCMQDLLKKVTLIVNVDCKVGGDSNSACSNLQMLYDKYNSRGFEILAFPCDQFQIGDNRFCTASEIKQDLVKRYGVSFPIMNRVNVNGETAHPLFVFLQKRLPGFPTDAIKWDFTKFLVVDGEPKKRYAPTTPVKLMEAEIAEELGVPLPPEESATGSIKQGLQNIYQQGKFETGKMQETIKHGLQAIGIAKPSSPSREETSQMPMQSSDMSRQQDIGCIPSETTPPTESRSELQSPMMSRRPEEVGETSLPSQLGSQTLTQQAPPLPQRKAQTGSDWNRDNTDTTQQNIDTPQTVRVTEVIRQVELKDSESSPSTSMSQGFRNVDIGGDQPSTFESTQPQSSNLRVTAPHPQATVPELSQSPGKLHEDSSDRI